MKIVIITAPMMNPEKLKKKQYPVDGNKSIEYEKEVCCPINGILAKTLKKCDEVKIIYIMTTGKNSNCEHNKSTFISELEDINKNVGASFVFDTVDIPFEPTKETYNKLITDLAEKIPENAEIYTDITFGSKPEILSLFCALRFVEEFRNAIVQYIVYGKAEFNKDGDIENPKLYDITSLYYLFKLMGTMGATNAESATETLKDFFAM
jgi:hypothetical protein